MADTPLSVPPPTTIATTPPTAMPMGSQIRVSVSKNCEAGCTSGSVSHVGLTIGEGVVTRRTLLRSAAAGALASGALPAWARIPAAAGRLRRPDSLPFPHLPAGTASMHQIKHVVVLMMENQSFDGVLGMLPHQVPTRGYVDGLTVRRGRVVNSQPDGHGGRLHGSHFAAPCQLDKVPNQDWNASHIAFAGGRMDGFVKASGPVAMRHWDKHDLPFTYALATHFPIGQRYFCSTLCQTYPNRRFFFCGTASGLIATDKTSFSTPAANGTIFDRLDAHGISWINYFQNLPSLAIVPGAGAHAKLKNFDSFASDVAAGKLPQFTFLDPNYNTTSEENPQNIQVGEDFIAKITHTLMSAPTWKHTALFITYDEHGGYYDHVPPPKAIKPDNIPPKLGPGNVPGAYDRYGFRVPLMVVSPWAKPGYASTVVQDHTSLLAFIERKWNLPAMTFRDANADAMTDYFDFRRAAFARPPRLPPGPPLGPGLAKCKAVGRTSPLPTTPNNGATDVGRSLQAHWRP
jgi:phospholipase C